MNAERLHALVNGLTMEFQKTSSVDLLQGILNSLQAVVNGPPSSRSPRQAALGHALSNTYDALGNSPSDNYSPAMRQLLQELGGEDLVGNLLRLRIEAIFARNQITPDVALSELASLHHRVTSFRDAVRSCASALDALGVGKEDLKSGECEIGVLIPRKAVGNRLPGLADELEETSFILGTISEVATGTKDKLEVRSISSSDFLLHLKALAPYAACAAVCVERVVALYRQLLEIRKLQMDIRKQNLPAEVDAIIEKHVNSYMEAGLRREASDIIERFYKKGDPGRRNELCNALTIALNKLANRIDKGFNVEVRCEPLGTREKGTPPPDPELLHALKTIQSLAKNMQFLKLDGQPILKLPESIEKPPPGNSGDGNSGDTTV